MTDVDLTEARGYIASAKWTFAKTMPKSPHWYTVRGQTPIDRFEWFVTFIRENGYIKKFGKAEYIYLDVDDHSYWTMGVDPRGGQFATLDKTTIINRRLLDHVNPRLHE